MLSLHDREQVSKIVNDWKLTPATLGYKLSRGEWIPSPHLLYVSSVVASGIARGNARIIISAPPRHGKSQLIDIYTPIWVLERFQNQNVILASYGAELSEIFGRQVRDAVANEVLLTCELRQDSKKVMAFQTKQGGGMVSVGLGGAITGRGADVLLIDDYIKEIKEALSPTYREYIWNWFITTAYTRIEPGGSCIIIATRWHSDDLIGRILQNFPGQWTNIVLRADAEADDILGRPIGAPLFPERYPRQRLDELKEVLGSTFYQALYQQRPVDEAKKITDANWLQVVEQPPVVSKLKQIRAWDLAATEGGGDYSTGSRCAYDPSNGFFYIMNIVRHQYSSQQVEAEVRKCAIDDGQDVTVGIEQEPGSAGKALVNHYTVNVLPEFKVIPIPTAGKNNKLIRAQPLLAAAEGSKVLLVRGHWNKAYALEFDSFPGGAYDDQVDTTAAAYTQLSGKKIFSAVWGRGRELKQNQPNAKFASENMRHKAGTKGIKAASFQISSRRAATFGRRRDY